MAVINMLNDEELEKVTGGEEEEPDCPTRNVIARYRNEPEGTILNEDLGRFEKSYAETYGETLAKQWCANNNKIYYGYEIGNILTNNYETRILLDSIGS